MPNHNNPHQPAWNICERYTWEVDASWSNKEDPSRPDKSARARSWTWSVLNQSNILLINPWFVQINFFYIYYIDTWCWYELLIKRNSQVVNIDNPYFVVKTMTYD